MMTDAVQIKDAWVINISVRFSIYTQKGFNKNEVLLSCVDRLKEYFRVEKWQINQPIVLADVVNEIIDVEGVRTVVKPQEGRDELIKVTNKWGTIYSNNIYDIQGSTYNGVVYPPVDPTMFEVKYPDIDIRGRVLGDL